MEAGGWFVDEVLAEACPEPGRREDEAKAEAEPCPEPSRKRSWREASTGQPVARVRTLKDDGW